MKLINKTLIWLCFFSVAMGFLETTVVIYLRQIYYPAGFDFPLVPIPPRMAVVEILREAATLVMLVGIGVLSGKSPLQRFAFFLFSFAIWDLSYYLFLKLLIDWPASLLTWDILFLIPLPWVGPVWAPCLLSVTMILFAFVIIYSGERVKHYRLNVREWIFLLSGCLVTIYSFLYDYMQYTIDNEKPFWSITSRDDLFMEIAHYIPKHFRWDIFALGELLIAIAIGLLVRRIRNAGNQFQGSGKL